MIKKVCFALSLLTLAACSTWRFKSSENMIPEPDYDRFVNNVSIVSESATQVTYEYRNVRIDELAVLAALYCNDQADKQAYLDKITLHRNNARRAVFICKQY